MSRTALWRSRAVSTESFFNFNVLYIHPVGKYYDLLHSLSVGTSMLYANCVAFTKSQSCRTFFKTSPMYLEIKQINPEP